MPFSDSYAFEARVQPALLSVLPFGLLILAVLPNYPLVVTALIALLSTAGGPAISAQMGGDKGRKKEAELWASWGGPPTTRLLRHRRIPGDIILPAGIRQEIELWAGFTLPNEKEETACPTCADAKYQKVVASLREATRDKSRFPLVAAENINYGFRRNLWGLKPIGASSACILALVSWTLTLLTVWGRPWPDPWWDIFRNPDSAVVVRLIISIVGSMLVAFWLLKVRPGWIKIAAEGYATRLLRSIQLLGSA